MNIVNLTPHVVDIYPEPNKELHISPSGVVARVKENRRILELVEGIEITETEYGEVTDLPKPQPETAFIVSSLVLEHSPGRDDLLVPDGLVRDCAGRIIGCSKFARRIRHVTDLV